MIKCPNFTRAHKSNDLDPKVLKICLPILTSNPSPFHPIIQVLVHEAQANSSVRIKVSALPCFVLNTWLVGRREF